jgi:hypothetical protein
MQKYGKYGRLADWLNSDPVAAVLEEKIDEWAFSETALLRWQTGRHRPALQYQLSLADLVGVDFAAIRDLMKLPCTPVQSWLVREVTRFGGVTKLCQKADSGEISESTIRKYLEGVASPSMESCSLICRLISRANPDYPLEERQKQIHDLILVARASKPRGNIGRPRKKPTATA